MSKASRRWKKEMKYLNDAFTSYGMYNHEKKNLTSLKYYMGVKRYSQKLHKITRKNIEKCIQDVRLCDSEKERQRDAALRNFEDYNNL